MGRATPSWYSSTDKDSLVNLPACQLVYSSQSSQDKIPLTMIHLNYNGNISHVFESYLNPFFLNVRIFELEICICTEIWKSNVHAVFEFDLAELYLDPSLGLSH